MFSRNQSVKERVFGLRQFGHSLLDDKQNILNYRNTIPLKECRSRVKQKWKDVVITDAQICQNRGNFFLAHLMGESSWNAKIAGRNAKVTEHAERLRSIHGLG